ncbi:hypothetical protein FKM82_023970 [Ascaphus truei]
MWKSYYSHSIYILFIQQDWLILFAQSPRLLCNKKGQVRIFNPDTMRPGYGKSPLNPPVMGLRAQGEDKRSCIALSERELGGPLDGLHNLQDEGPRPGHDEAADGLVIEVEG